MIVWCKSTRGCTVFCVKSIHEKPPFVVCALKRGFNEIKYSRARTVELGGPVAAHPASKDHFEQNDRPVTGLSTLTQEHNAILALWAFQKIPENRRH